MWKKAVLGCVVWCLVSEAIAVEIEYAFEQPDSGEAYFRSDRQFSRLITSLDRVSLNGRLSNGTSDKVWVQVNEDRFVVFAEQGKFAHEVALREGVNSLQISARDGFYHTRKLELIRLKPAQIESVSLVESDGSTESIELDDLVDARATPLSVGIPRVRFAGKRGEPEGSVLWVKDQYGNPLLVEQDGRRFQLEYVLREGVNRLLFEAAFDNQVFGDQEVVIALNEPILIFPDPDWIESGLIFREADSGRWICQTPKARIVGKIPGLSDGSVTLSVNGVADTIPVKEHRFESDVSLAPNKVTTIKVTVSIMDQVYFDYIELSHRSPSVEVHSIREVRLDGSILVPDERIELDRRMAYTTRHPVVALVGRANISGEVPVSLVNRTNGESYFLQRGRGNFEQQVSLQEGRNGFVLRMGEGARVFDTDACEITLESPIIIDRVNGHSYTEGEVRLDSNELTLSGRIPFLSRGFLIVRSGEIAESIPVVDGFFEMDEPLTLDQDSEIVKATLRTQGRLFSREISVIAKRDSADGSD